jgi:hypothetical protein
MAASDSVWWCALCQVTVRARGVPKRLKHVVCGRWMERLRPKPLWGG